MTLRPVDHGDSAEESPAFAPGEVPHGAGVLVVTRGPNVGACYVLDAGVTRAGRHPDSDIFLDDITVSRRHAEITQEVNGTFAIVDVGSLNGTYVNRERIDKASLSASRRSADRQIQAGLPGGWTRVSSRTYLSIGDVLTLLREEFPDVTISKIRFLESQGLVNPERSPSGYRKFFEPDVERLRWVLRQQREHFLPLKVIRDRLAAGDLGDIEVEPGAETKAEPARRNGAASHPSHSTPDGSVRAEGPAASVGSSAGRSTPPSPASGGQRRGSANAAAGRTEAQMAQADNEAMARHTGRRLASRPLIPENASDPRAAARRPRCGSLRGE